MRRSWSLEEERKAITAEDRVREAAAGNSKQDLLDRTGNLWASSN